MLIIPIEDRIDWRHPPLLVLSLLLINILLYLFSVSYDQRLYDALDEIDASTLLEQEWPLFLQYSKQEDILYWQEIEQADTEQQIELMRQLWFDRSWDQHIHAHWQSLDSIDEQWQQDRNELESIRNQLSWIRWGFTPGDPHLTGMMLSMFLHSDHWHLFGNMLFLMLFGLALERHWGKRRLLLIYLVAGISGNLLFWATRSSSLVPGIGASGAIAGLMGAYVATYGWRRIEFFYTLGFYFGSFRAPALLVFPAWLGKELAEHFLSDSNVNYMAHAGGLIGGLIMVWLVRYQWPRAAPISVESTDNSPATAPRHPIPAQLRQQFDQLAFDQALQGALDKLTSNPDNAELWQFALRAARRQAPSQLDRCMTQVYRQLGQQPKYDALMQELVNQYQDAGGDIARLKPACRLLEIERLWRKRDHDRARHQAEQLAMVWQHPRLDRLRQQLGSNVD